MITTRLRPSPWISPIPASSVSLPRLITSTPPPFSSSSSSRSPFPNSLLHLTRLSMAPCSPCLTLFHTHSLTSPPLSPLVASSLSPSLPPPFLPSLFSCEASTSKSRVTAYGLLIQLCVCVCACVCVCVSSILGRLGELDPDIIYFLQACHMLVCMSACTLV